MNVHLGAITPEQAIRIYESYRLDQEPDSPRVPFHALSVAYQREYIQFCQTWRKLIILDTDAVGYLYVRPTVDDQRQVIEEAYISFGLFRDFRGQGLMSKLLRQLVPELHTTIPTRWLTASTRVEHWAAMMTLLQAGFGDIGSFSLPPRGKYIAPIRYRIWLHGDPHWLSRTRATAG
jgi:GNAT superfamily N-acetyltransferase